MLLTCCGIKSAGVTQIGEQFTTAHILEKHVQAALVLCAPEPERTKISAIKNRSCWTRESSLSLSYMLTTNG